MSSYIGIEIVFLLLSKSDLIFDFFSKLLAFNTKTKSVIFFAKKSSKPEQKDTSCTSLDSINEIDVLDTIHYKKEHKILEILRLIKTKDLTQSDGINKLVLEIEMIKLDFAKNIFKKRPVEKKYVNSTLNNIISHLNT